MVILGILMAITIPNIMGILGQNKNNAYIEDAQKLVSAAKYKYSGSDFVDSKLADGGCIKMTIAYLNNGEFNDPPNGGSYFNNGSYVMIRKNGGITSYYVAIAETTDKKVYYIPYTKYEALAKNDGGIVQEGTSFPSAQACAREYNTPSIPTN